MGESDLIVENRTPGEPHAASSSSNSLSSESAQGTSEVEANFHSIEANEEALDHEEVFSAMIELNGEEDEGGDSECESPSVVSRSCK